MAKNDGGPAFPDYREFPYPNDPTRRGYPSLLKPEGGMSLRQWFAGIALEGLLASGINMTIEKYATLSYSYADAMLKEREKDSQSPQRKEDREET